MFRTTNQVKKNEGFVSKFKAMSVDITNKPPNILEHLHGAGTLGHSWSKPALVNSKIHQDTNWWPELYQ